MAKNTVKRNVKATDSVAIRAGAETQQKQISKRAQVLQAKGEAKAARIEARAAKRAAKGKAREARILARGATAEQRAKAASAVIGAIGSAVQDVGTTTVSGLSQLAAAGLVGDAAKSAGAGNEAAGSVNNIPDAAGIAGLNTVDARAVGGGKSAASESSASGETDTDGGMSTGAKVAIGAGVALGAGLGIRSIFGRK